MNLLERYEAIDRVIARLPAQHPTTPWWMTELDRFLGASCLRWVVRAGRRAGKSTTMCRLAVAVALSDHWRPSIPTGDRGVIAFVSVDRKEASNRLYTIATILRALGVPFDERGEEIELRDRPVVFRVITCSTSGVVGFTSIAIFCDELSRWEAGPDYANPAAEVLGSLRPTLAGIEGAIEVCVSSPWGLDDEHAKLFDRGDDDDQIVSYAPTWIARPSLTEAQTHRLESDPTKWRREYQAIPGSLEESAFRSEDVEAAFIRRPQLDLGAPRILCIDASRMKHDDFAWMVVSRDTDGLPMVVEVGGMSPPATTDDALEAIAEVAKRHHVACIYGDDYDADGNRRFLNSLGLAVELRAWTAPGKSEAGALLRRLIGENQIAICAHDTLRSQLLNQRAKLRPSNGQVDYPTNGRDYIACLFVFCAVVARGDYSIDARPRGVPTAAQWNAAIDAINSEFAEDDGPANAEQALQARTDSMFDLHRERLLRAAGVTPPEDCGHDDERKPTTLLDGYRWAAEQRKKRGAG